MIVHSVRGSVGSGLSLGWRAFSEYESIELQVCAWIEDACYEGDIFPVCHPETLQATKVAAHFRG